MTVAQLRAILEGHPDEMPVLIPGYESGWDALERTERNGDVLCVNACTCDSQYWPTQPPIVVDLDENGARHVPFSEWAR